MDYAIVRTAGPIEPQQTGALDAALKGSSGKVHGISVLHYTTPQVVVTHCGGEVLTDGELATLTEIVNSP